MFNEAQKLYDAASEYNLYYSSFFNTLVHSFFSYMEKESKYEKNRTGLRGFDDLIKDVESALKREDGGFLAESVRSRYRAALIDEFQDTNPVQLEIIKLIVDQDNSDDKSYWIAGDDWQSIYSFAGASVNNLSLLHL